MVTRSASVNFEVAHSGKPLLGSIAKVCTLPRAPQENFHRAGSRSASNLRNLDLDVRQPPHSDWLPEAAYQSAANRHHYLVGSGSMVPAAPLGEPARIEGFRSCHQNGASRVPLVAVSPPVSMTRRNSACRRKRPAVPWLPSSQPARLARQRHGVADSSAPMGMRMVTPDHRCESRSAGCLPPMARPRDSPAGQRVAR